MLIGNPAMSWTSSWPPPLARLDLPPDSHTTSPQQHLQPQPPSQPHQQQSHRFLDKQLPPSPPMSTAGDTYQPRSFSPKKQQQQQQSQPQSHLHPQPHPHPLQYNPHHPLHHGSSDSPSAAPAGGGIGGGLAKPPPLVNPLVEFLDIPAPHSGHIRVLQLNRPASRNAISYALLNALRKEIQNIQAQYSQFTGAEMPWTEDDIKGPTRALIIASSVDSCFCAGADLKELGRLNDEQ